SQLSRLAEAGFRPAPAIEPERLPVGSLRRLSFACPIAWDFHVVVLIPRRSRSRTSTATDAPRSWKRSAAALPIPRQAPVMMTTRPTKSYVILARDLSKAALIRTARLRWAYSISEG